MDFNKIPVMDRQSLRDLKKGIDQNFKEFSREYGDGIESFFDPLLSFFRRISHLGQKSILVSL